MGRDWCLSCAREDDYDDLRYSCCDKEVEFGGYCCRCSEDNPTKRCGKCNENFCNNHGDLGGFEKQQCCGLYLCTDEFEERDDGEEHMTKMLKCGHTGCNYYKEGCLVCNTEKEDEEEEAAMLQDKTLVEDLLKKSKSKTLKKSLLAWLKSVPSTTTKKRSQQRTAVAPKKARK